MGGWQATLLGCICATVWALPVRGDIYRYRDAHGVLHFSNAPTVSQYRHYLSEARSGSSSKPRRRDASDSKRRRAYDKIIDEAARRNRVDAALVKAVIRAESDFVPHAVSAKGALGLMQLMPETARRHNVWRIMDPRQNVEGGVEHLRYLLDRYAGNLRLALAAYNAGEKAVEAYGGVPPYPETWEYLSRVLRFRESYQHPH
jgi:soluble lytic murein transglycosylase-like protein